MPPGVASSSPFLGCRTLALAIIRYRAATATGRAPVSLSLSPSVGSELLHMDHGPFYLFSARENPLQSSNRQFIVFSPVGGRPFFFCYFDSFSFEAGVMSLSFLSHRL